MNRPSTDSPSDQELIARYLRGEKDSFQILFKRYKNRIFFFVRQFFRNREKAEEVFQEVFMKVIERLNTFDGLGSFKSWLYTLCRHHCIDRLRYQARRPEITESEWRKDEDTKPTPIQNTVSREIAADEHAYDNELAQALNEALQKLPEEQRETFLLKERGGLTFEEIATAHQVSINTVKSRMRYALESLRRALKGKNFVKEALQ